MIIPPPTHARRHRKWMRRKIHYTESESSPDQKAREKTSTAVERTGELCEQEDRRTYLHSCYSELGGLFWKLQQIQKQTSIFPSSPRRHRSFTCHDVWDSSQTGSLNWTYMWSQAHACLKGCSYIWTVAWDTENMVGSL